MTPRLTALEVGGRVALVMVCVLVLPDVFVADANYFWRTMSRLAGDHLPYRDFVWEFPPATVLVTAPAALLPSASNGFLVLFALVMAGFEYGTLLLLRAGRPERAGELTVVWTLLALPLSLVAYFRFDWMATFFAVLALHQIWRGRSGALAAAAGFASKLWPPVVALALVQRRRFRQVVLMGLATTAVLVAWVLFSPSGFVDFWRFREGDGLQIESLLGAPVFLSGATPEYAYNAWMVESPLPLLQVAPLVVWALLAALTALLLLRRPDADVIPAIGAVVLTLILASRVLSPQYLVWTVPFVVLCWHRGREGAVAWVYGAASALTLVVLFSYGSFVRGHGLLQATLVVRNGLLVAAAAMLLVLAFASHVAPVAPPRSADESRSPGPS